MALRFHRGPGLPRGTPLGAVVERVNEWLLRVENVVNGHARAADADDVEAAAVAARAEWVDAAKALAMLPTRSVSVLRESSTTYKAFRHLGGRVWLECQLTTGGVSGGPYSWNQTYLRELVSYVLAGNAACVTGGGAWTTVNSGDPNTYVGGTAKQAEAVGRTMTVTFTGSGDLYLVYVGRTAGNYVKCTLDGSTENCNALPSNGTYRYVDTYTATDLQYKQRVKVAADLAAGSHTLLLEVTSDKNAGSTVGTHRFLFNGIGLSGAASGLPYQSDTRTPAWAALTVYAQYDQVQVEGRYYYASVAGTSSSTAPTHTSSTAVDGTVTWSYMLASSYALLSHRIQAAGSQLEYAYQYKPASGGSLEDVGGILHGNEALSSATWYVDGFPVTTPAVADWLIGETVALRQVIDATHTATGATVVNQTTLTHTVHRDRVSVAHEQAWQVAGALGYFYAHMWPLLAWSVATEGDFRWGIDYAASPQGAVYEANDYSAVTSASPESPTEDYVLAAWGDVLTPAGAAGVPSAVAGPMTALCLLVAAPDGLARYATANTAFAGAAMNISGVTVPGFSSQVVKLYMERAAASAPVAVAAGEVWRASADYHVLLAPGSSVAFPPA